MCQVLVANYCKNVINIYPISMNPGTLEQHFYAFGYIFNGVKKVQSGDEIKQQKEYVDKSLSFAFWLYSCSLNKSVKIYGVKGMTSRHYTIRLERVLQKGSQGNSVDLASRLRYERPTNQGWGPSGDTTILYFP
jgi:hypothetical protein